MKKILLTLFLLIVCKISLAEEPRCANPYSESATKHYYEVVENKGKDALGSEIQEKIKWEKVKNKIEVEQKHNGLSNQSSLSGKKYRAYYHIHRHDDMYGNNRPCSRELIEEKK